MTTHTKVQERECPRCHALIVPVPIVYGYPVPELFQAADRGEVRLGGCLVGEESPELACPACDAALPWSRSEVAPGTR